MDGFVCQYAILMPNGELWRPPERPGFSLFGPPPPPATSSKPAIWDDRSEAEATLQTLREEAAKYGVTNWFGTVVQRICSPFTSADPAEVFATEVQEWLERGGRDA